MAVGAKGVSPIGRCRPLKHGPDAMGGFRPAAWHVRVGGRARGIDERGLHAPGGVEVVARPDHPHRGRRGVAVLAEQVVAHGLDEAVVGILVARERHRHLRGDR